METLTRSQESADHQTRGSGIHVASVETLANGWLKYTYDHVTEYRYVAPWFDAEVARGCGETHSWHGEWYLNGETLHCTVCGGDGT